MWTAPRDDQDWRDADVLAAVDWLTSLLPRDEWEHRAGATHDRFQSAKSEWASARRVSVFDAKDEIAWYLHQARCYADPAFRPDFLEPRGYRIATAVKRLGQLLPDLKKVVGAEDRAARLMSSGIHADDGIYELLVGATYKRRGWGNVEFVSEMPGTCKRPDLFVDRGKSHWAVECKRTGRSGYAREERSAGDRMADLVHERSRTAGRPIVIMARFTEELTKLPDTYLAEKVACFLDRSAPYEWDDDGGAGGVADVFWEPLRNVLMTDDIYFGSSRMIELLLGRYLSSVDYNVGGEWIPADGRPFHATSVGHVSVAAWTSMSIEAARRKAQHFKGVVGRASEQLPGDRPGVIHVGYEVVGGNSVDGIRHGLNTEQMRTFDARESGLRGVYGNYFMPEHVTARYESLAISESSAWYPARGSRTREPLPGHLLFMDEDGRPGAHFSR